MVYSNYLWAINQAMREEMARDAAVYVLGEDVTFGGPYGMTRRLVDEFGENRVVNTPISEGTVAGLCVGAAVVGLRPILECMFVDFITLAMDQLVNHAAKLHYTSGGQLKVPLTIRSLCGAAESFGAHHSQSFEAWFAHVPGFKVVMPATPADAKGLLKAAIRDDNPVLVLEHRGLLNSKGGVPEGDYVVPLGVADVKRSGDDVTVVAVSSMVGVALDAAQDLESRGISAEVIDLRTVYPLDIDTIASSVRKTNYLVVAHEAVVAGGIGAEIAARVQEVALDYLDGPIVRVGAPHSPVPNSSFLEKCYVPKKEQIVEAVHRARGRA
ncbi:MAG: alpha-ketoacid dehydrogenase subunit beta [Chloroflexi bacterium]|nr:alpha-ketoacid dehydrogenase subunit beta [Chloroflexota bacterium]